MAQSRPQAPKEKDLAALTQQNNEELREKEKQILTLTEKYKAQEKVKVVGSPMYQPHFGKAMPICLNGILISVPLDGRSYEIPESFAEVFLTRIRSVDDDINMQKRLSNVVENHEAFAGELDLVHSV